MDSRFSICSLLNTLELASNFTLKEGILPLLNFSRDFAAVCSEENFRFKLLKASMDEVLEDSKSTFRNIVHLEVQGFQDAVLPPYIKIFLATCQPTKSHHNNMSPITTTSLDGLLVASELTADCFPINCLPEPILPLFTGLSIGVCLFRFMRSSESLTLNCKNELYMDWHFSQDSRCCKNPNCNFFLEKLKGDACLLPPKKSKVALIR